MKSGIPVVAKKGYYRPMKKIILLTLGLLVITACSKPVTNWQKSGVSDKKWTADRAECLSRSRQQAEKDYSERPVSNTTDETDFEFRKFMSGYDTKRSQQKLMETCLRRLGYRPVEADSKQE